MTNTATTRGQIGGAIASGLIGGPLSQGAIKGGLTTVETAVGLYSAQYIASFSGSVIQQGYDNGSVSYSNAAQAGMIGGTVNTLQIPLAGLANTLSSQGHALDAAIAPFVERSLIYGVSPEVIVSGVNGLSSGATRSYIAGGLVSIMGNLLLPTTESLIGAGLSPYSLQDPVGKFHKN